MSVSENSKAMGWRTPRRRRSEPALVSGTSGEFLGRKPLPRSVRARPVIFILGPKGVGKTSVAQHLLGDHALHLEDQALMDSLAHRVRYRRWPNEIWEIGGLILDGPCFLGRRPAVLKSLQDLLHERVESQRRTVICQGADGSPLSHLIEAVSVDQRATVVLRFPVGRGRRRFANKVCDELGFDRKVAKEAAQLEPWTYAAVRRHVLNKGPL